ncbi:hypothetical protein ONZ45_g15435 [Pleurotus djamor]|nr:hypothetical protein ONZ45_g15435 [Pleurotus djamor]
MSLPLLKLPFLIMNFFMAYSVSGAPPKGPMSSSSSWFDWTHGMLVVWAYRIITVPFSLVEIVVIIYTAFISKPTSTNISLTAPFIFVSLLIVLGAGCRRHCMNVLGDQFTFKIGIQQGHKLVTTGPYSIVRHPSYTSGAVVYFASIASQLIPGSWLTECTLVGAHGWSGKATVLLFASLVMTPSIIARMSLEDRMLKATFGREWEEYRDVVRFKFFPGVY